MYEIFTKTHARVRDFILTLCGLFIFSQIAIAATPANTLIQNHATATYTISGQDYSSATNVDSFRVGELIDLTLTADNGTGLLVQSPQTGAVLHYTLTNAGNGTEKFSLTFVQRNDDDFDAANVKIYLDANNNGTFESTSDTLYVAGTNDPQLAEGAALSVFVVGDVPAGETSGKAAKGALTAKSLTGTGAPGTQFPGAGAGGVDATVGVRGGAMTVASQFVVMGATATLTKTQSISDPTGGTAPLHNAIITYTLALAVSGTGNLTNAIITDLIPANSTYQAGSLTLDSLPLTDAADSDAGVFDGTGIQVSLGTVPAPTTRTVTFKVRIQ